LAATSSPSTAVPTSNSSPMSGTDSLEYWNSPTYTYTPDQGPGQGPGYPNGHGSLVGGGGGDGINGMNSLSSVASLLEAKNGLPHGASPPIIAPYQQLTDGITNPNGWGYDPSPPPPPQQVVTPPPPPPPPPPPDDFASDYVHVQPVTRHDDTVDSTPSYDESLTAPIPPPAMATGLGGGVRPGESDGGISVVGFDYNDAYDGVSGDVEGERDDWDRGSCELLFFSVSFFLFPLASGGVSFFFFFVLSRIGINIGPRSRWNVRQRKTRFRPSPSRRRAVLGTTGAFFRDFLFYYFFCSHFATFLTFLTFFTSFSFLSLSLSYFFLSYIRYTYEVRARESGSAKLLSVLPPLNASHSAWNPVCLLAEFGGHVAECILSVFLLSYLFLGFLQPTRITTIR
jgi:hypothetical protein